MKRVSIKARPDWKAKVEGQGLWWHTVEGNKPYWAEAMESPVYYEFTKAEHQSLKTASDSLMKMYFDTVEWMLNEHSDPRGLLSTFNIPARYHDYIMHTWDSDQHLLYGRFDFVMVNGVPKLLEWNADTATTLVESAVIQKEWQQEVMPKAFQFNNLTEALVKQFQHLYKHNELDAYEDTIYFTCVDDAEDKVTTNFLQNCAKASDIPTKHICIDDIGADEDNQFVDLDEENMYAAYKLYPYDWMMYDDYGSMLAESQTVWFNPIWATLLANKAMLALLWMRYPDSPYLVPAYILDDSIDQSSLLDGKWVKKPMNSRTGSNVTIFEKKGQQTTIIQQTEGAYDSGKNVIYQQYIEWQAIDGVYPMVGVWTVGDESVAIGIREDDSLITGDNARFIPHVVV